ncbi:MAG: hypothetical protein IPJ13_31875 [Saprospiraceae bacterium]|nr:hypothetical protein [Saprospiraceae bacterium]
MDQRWLIRFQRGGSAGAKSVMDAISKQILEDTLEIKFSSLSYGKGMTDFIVQAMTNRKAQNCLQKQIITILQVGQ